MFETTSDQDRNPATHTLDGTGTNAVRETRDDHTRDTTHRENTS